MDNDLSELHWLEVKKRVLFQIALLVYKSLNPFVILGWVGFANWQWQLAVAVAMQVAVASRSRL